MLGLRRGVPLFVSCVVLAACGTTNNYIPSNTTMPPATATPVATATPFVAPASVATSAAFNGGVAANNVAVTAPVAAPTGYAQSVTIPLVSAQGGTTIATVAGAAPPASLVALSSARSVKGLRDAKDNAAYAAVLYDSIVPSANITASGTIGFNESFPAGALTAGASYYLAFYDTTQAAPTWQTIAGPVTPTAQGLTFTGSVSSVTLQAKKLYGFATFSVTTPTATPPPAPQTLLYYGNSTALSIANEAGVVQSTLPIPSQSFDIDDSGNIYAFDPHHGGTASANTGSPQLALYPAGTATATATYTLSRQDSVFVLVSGAGEIAAVHQYTANGQGTADIWDPGATGAPSREVTVSNNAQYLDTFAMTHDGTLYMFDYSSTSRPQYDVFAPGATTPSRTISESIVPQSQWGNFSPNYSAVGPDGTLYVTEYNFSQPDPNAGLYIYPPTGAERFIATASNANGAGPQGVDVDASGNIYVVNDNAAYLTATTCQNDSLNSVTVYNAAGTPLRTVAAASPGFTGFPITTAADGTSFVSSFGISKACPGVEGIFTIPPGSSTATLIPNSTGSTQIILYDGTHKTEPFAATRSVGGASRGGRAVHRLTP